MALALRKAVLKKQQYIEVLVPILCHANTAKEALKLLLPPASCVLLQLSGILLCLLLLRSM